MDNMYDLIKKVCQKSLAVEEAKKVLEWLDSPYCPLDEDFE